MDKETKKQQNLDYINNRINPILERLIVDLLISKPDNVVYSYFYLFSLKTPKEDYMIEWLNNHKSPVISLNFKEETQKKNKKKDEEASESDENDDDDDHEELLEIPTKKSPMNKGRSSVSAEAYGLYHKKSAYTPKFVLKSQEQKERIIKRLSQAFMFQALDEKEKEIVINAMEEKKFRFYEKQIILLLNN